jgi:hypothetical protein
MNSLKRNLILAAVLIGLVTAGAMMNPHTASATPPSTVIALKDAGSPIAIPLCTVGGNATISCGPPQSYTVGAGQLLIIENVSGNCLLQAQSGTIYLNDLSFQLTTGGQFANHEITGFNNSIVASSGAPPVNFTFAQPTRLYADPSTSVTLALAQALVAGSTPGTQTLVCNAVISGRLTTP